MRKSGIILMMLMLTAQLTVTGQKKALKAVESHRETNQAAILLEYKKLLEVPNVMDDLPNIERNASYLVNEFEKRGVAMELLRLPGKDIPPIIYGELKTPGADRTLVIYVHYDGQPADSTNWTHNPWQPTLYSGNMMAGGKPIDFPQPGEEVDPEWRIYGRSAADDKVPFPAILNTLDALKSANIKLTSNLKFFFEGEEEGGSPNLRAYLEAHKDKLDGDVWLFFDGPKHQSGRPQVVFGVRGSTGMEITVYGPVRPLHSGHYGGWSPVPGQILTDLLYSMKKSTGEILIEGYEDSTLPISEEDRRAFATLPDVDDQIQRNLGLNQTEFPDRSLIESYMHPTLTIRGLSSGNTGKLARNVIPTTATASLGMRMAKGNDPKDMQDKVEAHIQKQGFHIVREDPDMETRLKYPKIVKVDRKGGYPAIKTPIGGEWSKKITQAIQAVSEDEVILYPTMGGSLPLYHFEELMQKPIIIVPIANHDNNQHAPDENIRIGNIWYGMDIYASIFTMK